MKTTSKSRKSTTDLVVIPEPLVQTMFNYDWRTNHSIVLDKLSMTDPAHTFSVADIIERFRRGQSNNLVRVYDSPDDLSFIDNLSEFDRIDLHRRLVERTAILENDLRSHKALVEKENSDLARQKEVDALVAAKLKSFSDAPVVSETK